MIQRCSNVIVLGFALLLILAGCKPGTTPSPKNNLETNIRFLIEKGEGYWEKRVDPIQAKNGRLFLSKANRLEPANLMVAALYARTCYFIGYYIEEVPQQQDSLFLEGASAAWKILYESNSFQSVYQISKSDSATAIIAAIESIPESFVPVLYWWTANFSRYLATKSVIERLNHRDLIETALHRILALEPDYFYGGPYRIFGGIFARIPGVELSHSYTYFDQAIQSNPNYFGTYVLRAQYLHTKAGNKEYFIKDLEHVINTDPTIIPEVMPENLLEQEKAKQLLSQASLLFE